MNVLDPHKPLPTYSEQVSGRNVPLAHAVLGDLTSWVGARIHAGASGWARFGMDCRQAEPCRFSAGGNGVGRGDALVTIGIPAPNLKHSGVQSRMDFVW